MIMPLSTSEKFRLAARIGCLTPFQIFWNIVRCFPIAIARRLPLGPFLKSSTLRVFLRTLSPRQIQYLSSSTRKAYKAWVQRQMKKSKRSSLPEHEDRLSYDVEPLDDGKSSLLWLGNRQKARKVVLFLHGGCYVVSLRAGHLEWCWRTYVAAGIEAKVETAVAVLEYTLCPTDVYPAQLCQAAVALSHLISSGFEPGDIVVGGDSAGANLTAQLLCHLLQPHPVARPISLHAPLAGAFLVSPWLSAHTFDRSFAENRLVDMLDAKIVQKSITELVGYSGKEHFHDWDDLSKVAFPLDMEPTVSSGMSFITRSLYITTGDQDVLRDQAITFAYRVQEMNPDLKVRMDVMPKQGHDFILLEGQRKRDGESIREMKSWMREVLV